jgi:hypothetical protein
MRAAFLPSSNLRILHLLCGKSNAADAMVGAHESKAAGEANSRHGSQQTHVERFEVGRGYCGGNKKGLHESDDGVTDTCDREKTANWF